MFFAGKNNKGFMKIFIFGGPGSGKTTIADRLPKELNIKYLNK